jgi:hypothetical protein
VGRGARQQRVLCVPRFEDSLGERIGFPFECIIRSADDELAMQRCVWLLNRVRDLMRDQVQPSGRPGIELAVCEYDICPHRERARRDRLRGEIGLGTTVYAHPR